MTCLALPAFCLSTTEWVVLEGPEITQQFQRPNGINQDKQPAPRWVLPGFRTILNNLQWQHVFRFCFLTRIRTPDPDILDHMKNTKPKPYYTLAITTTELHLRSSRRSLVGRSSLREVTAWVVAADEPV